MHACKMIPNHHQPNPAYGPYAAMAVVLALHAVPCEWRMNMKTGAIRSRQLDDRLGEFPVINNAFTGRKTRYRLSRGDPGRRNAEIRRHLQIRSRQRRLPGLQV